MRRVAKVVSFGLVTLLAHVALLPLDAVAAVFFLVQDVYWGLKGDTASLEGYFKTVPSAIIGAHSVVQNKLMKIFEIGVYS